MAKKIFTYRGKTTEELQALSLEEFAQLLPSRERRKVLRRGFTDAEKTLLKDLEKNSNVKTHCRDMVVLPSMIGKKLAIHSGKQFTQIEILPQMIGQRFGELVLTRNKVKHGAVGVASAIKH